MAIIADERGSVRLVVDSSTGEVKQRLDYDAWGNVTQDTNPGFQPFGFAGGLYDSDTGLVHFGAREYDPTVGRWISKDPILFSGGQANIYVYVGDDPVNSIDPTGTLWGTGFVGGLVGGINAAASTYIAGDTNGVDLVIAFGIGGVAGFAGGFFDPSAGVSAGIGAGIGFGAALATGGGLGSAAMGAMAGGFAGGIGGLFGGYSAIAVGNLVGFPAGLVGGVVGSDIDKSLRNTTCP